MLLLALQLLSAMMIAVGAWFTLSASIAAILPEALGLSDVLAGTRLGPAVVRHTRLLAVLLALVGVGLFIAGTSVGIRSLA